LPVVGEFGPVYDRMVNASAMARTFGTPVPDRLRRRFELARQFLRRAAGMHQFDHLSTQFRWLASSRSGLRGRLGHKPFCVHETCQLHPQKGEILNPYRTTIILVGNFKTFAAGEGYSAVVFAAPSIAA
jgi:hypothetical protein